MSQPFSLRLQGLVAATHTPLNTDGSLRLELVDKQALVLQKQGVLGVFIAGSTGEGVSLTSHERMALAESWSRSAQPHGLKLVVHVGHTSSAEAAQLAAHAARHGADAVSAMAPFYFKPASARPLVDWIKPVAAACPETPFYFYDIPVMTGVRVNLLEFVDLACREIPNFHGIKYTSDDLVQLQDLLHFDNGRLDILYGTDEALLAALALGIRGGVGSSYNFAAGLYLRIIDAFEKGQFELARKLQLQSVHLISAVARHGYLPSAKRLMGLFGCDCGPVRPPLVNLGDESLKRMLEEVRSLQVLDPEIMVS